MPLFLVVSQHLSSIFFCKDAKVYVDNWGKVYFQEFIPLAILRVIVVWKDDITHLFTASIAIPRGWSKLVVISSLWNLPSSRDSMTCLKNESVQYKLAATQSTARPKAVCFTFNTYINVILLKHCELQVGIHGWTTCLPSTVPIPPMIMSGPSPATIRTLDIVFVLFSEKYMISLRTLNERANTSLRWVRKHCESRLTF